jgi:hypothetical protein
MAIVAAVVLFTTLFLFAVSIGVISGRDDRSREENAGNANP